MSWFLEKTKVTKTRNILDWDKVDDFEKLKTVVKHTITTASFTNEGIKALLPLTKEEIYTVME